MRIRRLLVLVALFAVVAVPAYAEEPNGEDSEAARLFREGWWLETGSGALDKATAKYAAAIAAEGSRAIRARSLYRLGVVLQRMGKTEEGVKALERLQQEFGSETNLIDESKKRLEEWVGQDLKESFGEWYRRYQYSPAFQAKVIDLVLELGANDYKVRNAALHALSTIGEPAVPALRAHAASMNSQMARSASDLLFGMRQVPPAEALIRSTHWTSSPPNRQLVLEADPATATAIRTALEGDERPSARMLRAAATGRLDLLREFLGQDKTTDPELSGLLSWSTDSEVPKALIDQLKALVVDEAAHVYRRSGVVSALRPERGQVTTAELHAWIGNENTRVRDAALRKAGAEGLDRTELWRAYATVIESATENRRELEQWTRSMLAYMRYAPAEADVSQAREVLAGRGDWQYVRQGISQNTGTTYKDNPAALRVLREVIEGAADSYGSRYLKTWLAVTPTTDTIPEQLLGWSVSSKSTDVRRRAMAEAARRWTSDPAPLLEILAATEAHDPLRNQFFAGLRKNPRATSIGWSGASISRLIEIVGAMPNAMAWNSGVGARRQEGRSVRMTPVWPPGDVRHVFTALFGTPRTRALLYEAMAKAPEVFPPGLTMTIVHSDPLAPGVKPIGVRILDESWPSWTTDKRKIAGIELCGTHQMTRGTTSWIEAFALRELERGRGANSLDVRRVLLEWTPRAERSLAAIQAVYDLSDPSELRTAVSQELRALPADAATYDAFAKVLESSSPVDAILSFDRHFTSALAPGGVLADRVTVHIERLVGGEEDRALLALSHLKRRNTTADMSIWHALLKHESDDVRIQVARALGHLYTQETIRELAALVDDPNPTIRDAALKSLKSIKQIEEQKDYWRNFAKDK